LYENSNERSELVSFKTDIWKLRGPRRGFEKGDALYVERKMMLCIYHSNVRKQVKGRVFE
jgi:hypothetical protein